MRVKTNVIFIAVFFVFTTFASAEEVEILNETVNSNTVEKYEKFEITFSLSKEYSNPFDPNIINIEAYFTAPSGDKVEIPAFYYQEYKRELSMSKNEGLSSIGNPCWKVRFTPTETGDYFYYLTINGKPTEKKKFDVVDSRSPGFIRICESDYHYLEFDDGDTYYPIGHNVRYPKRSQKGTYMYDDYIYKMSVNGENWTALWMDPNWLGLEWLKDEDGYQGLGRYNIENAWRLDYIIEKAHERGIYIILFLINHGQLANKTGASPDGEWDASPYNTKNGGFLANPAEYYTDERAKELFKQMARYVIARWGYSTNIVNWSLISEVDLTELYIKKLGMPWSRKLEDAGEVLTWHEEMAKYIKEIDPWEHLVSTSFAHMPHGLEMWQSSALDVIQSTGFVSEFGDNPISIINSFNKMMEKYKKPFFVLEYGGRWDGNTDDALEASLHGGIWMQFMTQTGGSTGFWWWDYVDKNDMYYHFKALADFSLDEDKRGINFEKITPEIEVKDKCLRAQGLRSEELIYLWIYHKRLLYKIKEVPIVPAGAILTLSSLTPGKYNIEFWDTYEGEITQTVEGEASEKGILEIKLPEVLRYIACKIKLIK